MTAHYVVTPVRNAATTIDETIWSVVSQEGGLNIHYHIQDGASTDGTLTHIEAWAERLTRTSDSLPSRVHFSFDSRPDNGMYAAIAAGFSGMEIPPDAFMNWCNADDALWPGALRAVARLGHDLPEVDWLLGWPTWFDEIGRFIVAERTPRYPRAILAAGLADGMHWPFVQQESTFWRKRLWDQAGGLDTSLRLAGDWDLWVRFAQCKPLVHAHRQLGGFHLRPGQQSADMERYRAEMNGKLSGALRRLPPGTRTGALTAVPWAMEDSSGHWQLGSRACSCRARWAARVLARLPVSSPSLTKFIYDKW